MLFKSLIVDKCVKEDGQCLVELNADVQSTGIIAHRMLLLVWQPRQQVIESFLYR